MSAHGSKSLVLRTTLGAFFALTIAACGHENKLYRDPIPVASSPAIGDSHASALPHGFFDQSVNLASAELALDGASSTTLAVRLRTKAGTNPAGGFNGGGTGNRALLGIGLATAKKLSELGSGITFDAKVANGSLSVGATLLVDLDCSGVASRLLTAAGADLGAGTAQPNGYTRFSAGFNEPRWFVSGTAITEPGNASNTLVAVTGSASALTDLITHYPNACIRNDKNSDDSLPKNATVAGILLTLGEPSTDALNEAFVNRVTIGSDVYDSATWGSL